MMAAREDPRVIAVREDWMVGRGSLSWMAETMDAEDLLEAIESEGAETPSAAVTAMRALNNLLMVERWERLEADLG